MSEEVERVTKAIREKREMSLCALCDLPGRMIRCSCEEMAAAAIEAMRKPAVIVPQPLPRSLKDETGW